jgi:hypothetical protein
VKGEEGPVLGSVRMVMVRGAAMDDADENGAGRMRDPGRREGASAVGRLSRCGGVGSGESIGC